MTWLWSKVSAWIAPIGAAIALLFAAWLKGRQEGKSLMREEQERHRREVIAAKRKHDSEIDDLAPADLDGRFQRWVRQPEQR